MGLATLVGHELAHGVLPFFDDAIKRRIGLGEHANILDELNADAGNINILAKRLHRTGSSAQTVLKFLSAYCADYIVNWSSGDAHGSAMNAQSGKMMLNELLTSGVLVPGAQGYRIAGAARGLRRVSKIAHDVYALYADDNTRPKDAKSFVDSHIANADANPDVHALLSFVGNLGRDGQT